MKKILFTMITISFGFLLSACNTVPIKPGVVDVVYENVHYEGSSLIVEVWITNGTDDDIDVGYVDFWFEFPEGTDLSGLNVTEFCGAGFPIDETIKSQGYGNYELEFTSEYIFVTNSELEALGLNLDDLLLYFEFE